MLELSDYFGTYAHVAPSWGDFVEKCMANGGSPVAGFHPDLLEDSKNQDGSPMFIEVGQENFPRLYQATVDECNFRNIPMPAVYVDTTGEGSGGRAFRNIYAFHVERDLIPFLTDKELRWIVAHEVKHLHQCDYETPEESLLAEDDCDKAAVESTDYKTAVSFFQKLAAFKIGYKTGVSPTVLNTVLPAFLTSHFPLSVSANETTLLPPRLAKDEWHRSPLARMGVMKEHTQSLAERTCDHS